MVRARLAPFATLVLLLAVVTGCAPKPPVGGAMDDADPSGTSATAGTGAGDSSANPLDVTIDPELPDYRPVEGLSGRITSVGSDTMNNLMAFWAEGFKRHYPQVEFEIEGKGSSTAIPALIAGAATFGPMSRDPKSKEKDDFEARFGHLPVQLPTSIDMLAVYVNKDNPIKGLTLPEVDAIFSKTRKLGGLKDLTVWGDLGLDGEWTARTISAFGRNTASGTYGYFKEHALGDGDFKDSIKEQPGSSSVVQGVGSDISAIGYSGIGYRTADVRAVPLAAESGGEFVPAEPKFAFTGEYPLARYLWLTVNYRPQSELEPLPREFIKYIFSRQGQAEVIKDGYLPVPAETAKRALESVNLHIE